MNILQHINPEVKDLSLREAKDIYARPPKEGSRGRLYGFRKVNLGQARDLVARYFKNGYEINGEIVVWEIDQQLRKYRELCLMLRNTAIEVLDKERELVTHAKVTGESLMKCMTEDLEERMAMILADIGDDDGHRELARYFGDKAQDVMGAFVRQ